MKRIALPIVVAAVIAGAGLTVISGLKSSASPSSHEGATSQACMMPPPSPSKSKPVIGVLTDTITKDQNPKLAGVRTQATKAVTSAGFSMQARLLMDTIGSGAQDADLAVNTQLVATGANELFRNSNMACKQTGVASAISTLNRQSNTGSLDVLSALTLLQEHLTGLTRAPIYVVLLSSMLNGTAPLDLTNSTILNTAPQTLIGSLRAEGLMPNCDGWNVYVVGGGITSSGTISDPANTALRTFWSDFFSACGGQLVVYDSQLTQFPVHAIPRRPLSSDASYKHLAVSSNGRTIKVSLPGAVLFPNGSAVLTTQSTPTLGDLLGLLTTTYKLGHITVIGYTDNVPINMQGGNVTLSYKRAQAVANWLERAGISKQRMTILGLGSSSPVASNAVAEGRAQNRRVEVDLTIPGGS